MATGAQIEALTQALTNFTTAIAALAPPAGGGGAPPPPAAAHVPIHDLYLSPNAFDLSTRAGLDALKEISKPLDCIWDGTGQTFPAFLVAIKLRANEGHWNATGATGIFDVNGKDLIDEYHSIDDADVTAAKTARTDDRAIQNAKALFKCLKCSISGNLKTTIFSQPDNIPKDEDGVALFKKFTEYTTLSSVQLSLSTFSNLLKFDPAQDKFDIAKINTRLLSMFVLCGGSHRTLDKYERIQHTLNAYDRIKQPDAWSRWVNSQKDEFNQGNLTNCQDFMNSALLKYNQISLEEGGFNGSVSSVQEDIISMVAQMKKGTKRKKTDTDDSSEDKSKGASKTKKKKELPPFLKHFKTSKDATGKPYKVGDTKTWKEDVWYYCDCPNHRDGARWHTFTADECRTRQRWLEKQKQAHANLGDAKSEGGSDGNDGGASTDGGSAPAPATIPQDEGQLTALLASAMNLVGDNGVLKDLLADAINHAEQA